MPAQLERVPLTIFQRFFRTEALGGLVLLGFALAALVIANSLLSEAYNHLWEISLTVGIAPLELSLSLHECTPQWQEFFSPSRFPHAHASMRWNSPEKLARCWTRSIARKPVTLWF
jgi:hypothetical protein